MTERPLRLLLLEDSPTDAELNVRVLRRAGLEFESHRVETREDFLAALDDFQPDAILADFGLPRFDGLAALRLTRERSLIAPSSSSRARWAKRVPWNCCATVRTTTSSRTV
ncbi:MAG: response regulator [Chromatiales bacterium]|nr:response regulator [Chromatiales bacterium]